MESQVEDVQRVVQRSVFQHYQFFDQVRRREAGRDRHKYGYYNQE